MNRNLTTRIFAVFLKPFGKKASCAFYLLCPILSFYLLEFLTHNPFEDIHPGLHLFSWLLYILFYSACFLIIGRMDAAFCTANLLVMAVGVLNFFTLQFRSSPILPWDIRSLGTALSVANNQTFEITPLLIGIVAGYLLLCLLTCVGAVVGAGLIGKLVGFYPVEAAITAGLCMANMGGTGDVAVLSAADRMELMPFAQISSRLGGAIILIIGSLMLSVMGGML